ncbi:MAG: cobalt transporter CbiM [Deltaproteobacteria bacterium]|nr:cobalt transporter CbiM [Deltaproteobacteria bacterium]
MHISEGVLSGPVLAAGMGAAAVGVAAGIRKLDADDVPRAALLSAAFFVASLVHVPVGPASVHLVLNGLVGLILGWAAFPAILTGLVLQAVLFSHGGITVLGVNLLTMAVPAVACGLAFRPLVRGEGAVSFAAAFACGFLSVLFAAVLAGAFLVLSDENFLEAAGGLLAANLPVMVIEGFVTGFLARFLVKIQPEILGAQKEKPSPKKANG